MQLRRVQLLRPVQLVLPQLRRVEVLRPVQLVLPQLLRPQRPRLLVEDHAPATMCEYHYCGRPRQQHSEYLRTTATHCGFDFAVSPAIIADDREKS